MILNSIRIKMKNINHLLKRTSTPKNLLFLFLISHTIFWFMISFSLPKINSQIGDKVFDIRPFGYSIIEARTILSNLNEETINFYIFPQLSFLDILYPFFLALFLSSLLFRLINISELLIRSKSILLMIPFIAMIFDYLENFCVLYMITHTSSTPNVLIHMSSIFTILKGVSTTIAWVSILLFSITFTRTKILKRKFN